MAKTSARGLAIISKRLFDIVEHLPAELFDRIGKYVADRIVMKARTGKRMVNGREVPIKALSPRYIEQRKKMKKSGAKVDDVFFSPKRSNLTRTGQYLKSIKVTETDRAKNKIVIAPSPKSSRGDGVTNEDLAKYLGEQGRNIFGIDATTRKVITKMVKEEIRKQIKRNVLRK